jgi:hypothetical protein
MQALGLLNPLAVLKDDGHTVGELELLLSLLLLILFLKNNLMMLPTKSEMLANILSYLIFRSL